MSFYHLPNKPHAPVGWSQPLFRIVEANWPKTLQEQVNGLLQNEDLHVLAVSAASVSVAGSDSYPDIWTATVILQEKIDPNGAVSGDENGGAE